MRYLILFLLILFAVWWVRRALSGGGGDRSAGAGRRAGDSDGKTERMLECAHCGVHVPEREGVSEGRHFYCSEAHRRLGPSRGR